MAVTYTREQRRFAKEKGLTLATLAVTGMEFQGPISEEERREVLDFMTGFLKRRREWLKRFDQP